MPQEVMSESHLEDQLLDQAAGVSAGTWARLLLSKHDSDEC
jgi:hypothetical protein